MAEKRKTYDKDFKLSAVKMMRLRFYQSFLPALLLIMLLISCNGPSSPIVIPLKDPREMTWTCDTLAYEGSDQTLMTSLYATSPNNAWICGHNDRSAGNVWHYNGEKWQYIEMYKYIRDSPNGYYKVSGSSANNVWFVGNRHYSDPFNPSTIWWEDLVVQYDGSTFKEHPLNTSFRTLGVHCVSPNEVWVCGDSGLVAKYDGKNWNKDTIKIRLPANNKYFLKSIARYKGEVYLIATAAASYYFIKGNIGNWNIADSISRVIGRPNIRWGIWGLYVSPAGKLYSHGGGGIWVWENGWKRIFDTDYTIKGMTVVDDDYIIATADFGNVFFYDGVSWTTLEKLKTFQPNNSYADAWGNGQELILLSNNTSRFPMTTIVLRGK